MHTLPLTHAYMFRKRTVAGRLSMVAVHKHTAIGGRSAVAVFFIRTYLID